MIQSNTNLKPKQTFLINAVGDKITESIKINNMFNTYFSNIGKDLAANIENPDSSCTMTCTCLIPPQYNSFSLKPITESEVFRYLQQLNPAKSPGPNNIQLKYIKLSSQIVAPILTDIYNKCVESGSYPDILKIA